MFPLLLKNSNATLSKILYTVLIVKNHYVNTDPIIGITMIDGVLQRLALFRDSEMQTETLVYFFTKIQNICLLIKYIKIRKALILSFFLRCTDVIVFISISLFLKDCKPV